MARCETCGNDYDKAFQVSMDGTVGHGLEKDGTFFCCEHCAEAIGVTGLRDRVGAAA